MQDNGEGEGTIRTVVTVPNREQWRTRKSKQLQQRQRQPERSNVSLSRVAARERKEGLKKLFSEKLDWALPSYAKYIDINVVGRS